MAGGGGICHVQVVNVFKISLLWHSFHDNFTTKLAPDLILTRHCSAVRTVQRRLGWRAAEDEGDTSWDVLWTDSSVTVDRLVRLHPTQVAPCDWLPAYQNESALILRRSATSFSSKSQRRIES